jgi:phytol kinase
VHTGEFILENDVFVNVVLMFLCYAYILFIIFVSGKMDKLLNVSWKTSRKFLHAMIGNLPFIIPFFTVGIFPVLVAAPFILVTFFASPYSPFKKINKKMRGLVGITEEGHQSGLVFYAISYTFLALFFASKPCVIAAGILPMAYGDSVASMVGERYGRRRYKLVADKSLEGSAAMFLASFFTFTISLAYFSLLYHFSVFDKILASLAVATVATLAEGFSPMGFDNLTVPIFSALTFLSLGGGI